MVDMRPITNSSNVVAAGYDEERKAVLVRFKSSDTYAYEGADSSELDGLLAADSAGRYVNDNLKGQYPTRRV